LTTTVAENVSQAEKNESFSRAIAVPKTLPERCTDWEVISLFYSALHYVDAFLVSVHGVPAGSHKHRNFFVGTTPDFNTIAIRYKDLYERSREARYDLVPMAPEFMDKLELEAFRPIRAHMRALLNLPG
jgi:hypothetical protein